VERAEDGANPQKNMDFPNSWRYHRDPPIFEKKGGFSGVCTDFCEPARTRHTAKKSGASNIWTQKQREKGAQGAETH